jgi:hypothetical protein
MNKYPADHLFLNGRLQVETALGALRHTGANPDAQSLLQLLLDCHDQKSDGTAQNDLSISARGETAEKQKADIVASLEIVSANEDVSTETRAAAVAVREFLD